MIDIDTSKIYNHPVTLSGAIKDRKISEKLEGFEPVRNFDFDVFVKEVDKNKELSKMKITKYIGRGASAIAFETADGNVLKLSQWNHFPMNRPHQCFDVPVYKKGKAGKIFYYIEEKLYQHSLSEEFVLEVKDMIRKAGFKPYDLYDCDCFQIGLSKTGELYLLDPECARYKTIFHALWDKLKRFCKK